MKIEMEGDDFLTKEDADFVVDANKHHADCEIILRWYGYLVAIQEREGLKRLWHTNRKDTEDQYPDCPPNVIYHGPGQSSGPLIDPPRPFMEEELDMNLEDIHKAQEMIDGSQP